MPKISIIIPTLNEEFYIGLLLKDLENQTLKPYQVIVVDGNSTDQTIKVVRKFNTTIIKTGRGVGMQRTTGAKKAKADLVYFLDADVRLDRDFLRSTAEIFIKKNLDIATPLYLPYKSTLPIQTIYWIFNGLFILTQHLIPSGAGSCMIIANSVLKKTEFFNPDLTYDDIEFIRRVGSRNKFGVLMKKLYVSDRRFREHGTLKMLALYLLLSLFFFANQFRLANNIGYSFGSYTKTPKDA